jgi:hypothetical protein
MNFTVANQIGSAKDADFIAYLRLLGQQGVNLGKAPRVPEPGTNRRWLYAWPTGQEAQAFAEELNARKKNVAPWQVVETTAPTSEGPLTPLLIQLMRQGGGFVFGIHILSLRWLRSLFPNAFILPTFSIETESWEEFRAKHRTFADLAREVLVRMTGMTIEQLNTLGYVVFNVDTDETLVAVPPGDLPHAGAREVLAPVSATA